MLQKTSKKIKILLWCLLVLAALLIVAQILFSQKVKTAIAEQIPENISLQYGNLSTNVLLGKIQLEAVEIKNKSTLDSVRVKKLRISGLHYLPLVTKKAIQIDHLLLETPVGQFRKPAQDSLKKTAPKNKPQTLSIGKFTITEGQLTILKTEIDSVLLQLEKLDFSLSDFHFDPDTTQQKQPFTFGAYQLETQNLYADISPFEYLRLGKIQLDNEYGVIEDMVFRNKYSAEEFNTKITMERSHFNVSVDKIRLNQPDFLGTDIPKFHAPSIEVEHPVMEVYRNKLLPPNTIVKKLPNQMLREMEVDLKIDSILVSGGEVSFTKKTIPDVIPQKMILTDLNVRVKNLNNQNQGLVVVDSENKIMGDGLFTMNYTFDPQNTDNAFIVKSSVSNFHTKSINAFMRSTLDVEVDGTINQMFFTVDGNEWTSLGEMKMNYEDFTFTALKKDHVHVNKLKSSVANLLTKKGDRKADEDGFRHGQFHVERDRTKWIIFYIWDNMKTGMMHTMLGSGKER
ncbi:hypothetical protein J0X14_04745 [Muricauda sp. CAU 1633]|uniref:hypothetical protein n=1 Tax=Allomuricauda sp. CAU 1633 TaxID=2816036 RepID=UPI001A8CB219|nr:hypothetical protein [Muricauda sp. CAU 1633]MBO0321596.1 hypothetical protein [Muricauda sp. CAU 1633]